MNDEFRDGNANISQFTKREQAWMKIRNLKFILDIPRANLLDSKQKKDLEVKKKELNKMGSEVESLEKILKISMKEWIELSNYLKNEEDLPHYHNSIKLINFCISYHKGGKPPNKNQSREVLDIREEALSNKFSYFE